MDERETAIFESFAKWATKTRAEYVERYENDKHEEIIKQITSSAMDAFKIFDNSRINDWGDWRDPSMKKEFERIAATYFLHRLDCGKDAFYSQHMRLEAVSKSWSIIETALHYSENIAQFIDLLEENYSSELMYVLKILDLNEFSNDKEGLLLLQNELTASHEREYEKRFGERTVYEDLGRRYAEIYFNNIVKKKKGRGARPVPKSTHFYKGIVFDGLVEKINSKLSCNNFNPTTAKEVCELSFGTDETLSQYTDQKDIRWALKVFFRIENITVNSFMNILTSGRRFDRKTTDIFDES